MKLQNSKPSSIERKIALALRLLQSLEEMELAKKDALEVQLAKGLLMGIIAYGGYRAKYHWLFGIRLLRAPKDPPKENIKDQHNDTRN